jgi:hypothetical protein
MIPRAPQNSVWRRLSSLLSRESSRLFRRHTSSCNCIPYDCRHIAIKLVTPSPAPELSCSRGVGSLFQFRGPIHRGSEIPVK